MMLALSACQQAAHTDSTDVSAIQQLLHQTYDQSGKLLTLDPVIVQGGDAIVGWTQGDMGGRALLRKQADQWVIVLCAGDAVKDAAYLQQAGLSAETAATLSAALLQAERKLPVETLALFARFGAPVVMQSAGGNGQAVHHE